MSECAWVRCISPFPALISVGPWYPVPPVSRQAIPLSLLFSTCQLMLEVLSQTHSADVFNSCSLVEFTVKINHDRALIEYDHQGDLGLSGGLTSRWMSVRSKKRLQPAPLGSLGGGHLVLDPSRIFLECPHCQFHS